ncbi:YqgE/AlgH family protein [Gimesia sp.]|uniref:YqgE/AlgH family protein n=1 Tax=Gimesia sp. TaxID=2024833 RepID=UPI003A9253E6
MLKSLKGQFLVASRKLNDLNFYRSVVLIVEHNEQGATGLIVNRPSSFSITNALSRYFDMPKLEDMVFMGGPVEPNGMFALHNAGDLEQTTEAIVPDLFMGSSPEIFEQVIWRISEGDPHLDFRIFFGCAGWAPLQLESEINRMDWLYTPAMTEDIFEIDPYDIWDTLLERAMAERRFLPQETAHPEWN